MKGAASRQAVAGERIVAGSKESIQAVAFAGRLARETGAGLTVVYARHIPVGYSGPPLEVGVGRVGPAPPPGRAGWRGGRPGHSRP